MRLCWRSKKEKIFAKYFILFVQNIISGENETRENEQGKARHRTEERMKRGRKMRRETREKVKGEEPRRVMPRPSPLQPLSISWKTGFHIEVLT